MESENSKPMIDIKNLSVSFRLYDSFFEQYYLQVISNLTVDVMAGEIMAIAGSSGSGKSLLAHAIMGILPQNSVSSGQMEYKGRPLTPELQRKLRGREIALIPQSVTYLDPLMRVGPLVRNCNRSRRARCRQRGAFERLNLGPEVERMYPFQLSGGMARRVLFATALIHDASLIIADEPTPGVDTKLAVEALQCLREFADSGKAVLLITHDIDLAFNIADRIAVFYAGTTLEIAATDDFVKGSEALRHPFSKALWHALPQNGFVPIPGFQPYARNLPKGCLFAPRCSERTGECISAAIPMRELRGGLVRCIHAT